jgi:hypothetical protein
MTTEHINELRLARWHCTDRPDRWLPLAGIAVKIMMMVGRIYV